MTYHNRRRCTTMRLEYCVAVFQFMYLYLLVIALTYGFQIHPAAIATVTAFTTIPIGSQTNIPSTATRTTRIKYSNVRDPPFYDDDRTATGSTSSGSATIIPFNPSQQHNQATKSSSSHTSSTVTTLDDLYNIVQECRNNNILLVLHWSAPWCKTCQRIAPLLHRTIRQIQHRTTTTTSSSTTDDVRGIRYINIPLLYSLSTIIQNNNHNKHQQNLHALFNIHTVPYCHIYHPIHGLQHEFTITASNKKKQQSKPTKTDSKSITELSTLLESYIL